MLIILYRQVAEMLACVARNVTHCAVLGLFFCMFSVNAAVPVRNVTPFAQGLGIPELKDGRLLAVSEHELESQILWTSFFYEGENDAEFMLIDGEAVQLDFFYRYRFEHVELGINIPFVRYSGGTMDNFIDFWHDTFNLPGGGRGDYPSDRLNFYYETAGERYELTQSYEGVADLRLSLGFDVASSADAAHALYIYTKLPTADNIWLSSGGADVGVALSHQFDSGRWQQQLQYAATLMGEADWLESERASVVYSAHAALQFQFSRHLQIQLQLDGNSDLFKNDKERVQSAGLLLGVGFEYDLNSDKITFMLLEDIIADTAPDVSFLLGYQARFE